MTAKLNPYTAAPEIMKPWMAVSDAVNTSLEHSLVELVKLRSSILNGCANCINMHTADARMAGESEQRLYLVAAWHEAPVFTPRERAALAWTDALTKLAQGHTHDAAWDALAEHFTEEECVKLTLLINVINGWNRIATAFGLRIETPATKKLAAA
ncbi:carboxymuconolactone decarboxylase family protein [Novosphingobium sp. JCM 18896]|uniref:carboxymuconolactone decarboxylase family protein n=1 Tax=Novosphingobium sp. JCM 18896 TaxID=2989731 RepID=UPI002223011B|nr:carboxymuconolactone decarboxylase family protein [Novosphingobium sp. JCM 18896]MCW1427848.1 carboxymuconolactone decarboxylase family protein [Novosphingobium sp. JCM 18896]